MSDQHYCLRWNNYQTNMTSVFHQLLENEAFVDVTLACNDLSLKAHKVVLSACSTYFRKLLLDNPCKHPTIIMPSDVCYDDLRFIIEFVYRGEIDVSQAELQSLLRTAGQLKIKGLCESPDQEGEQIRDLPTRKGVVEGHALENGSGRRRRRTCNSDDEEVDKAASSDEDKEKPVGCGSELNSNEEERRRSRRTRRRKQRESSSPVERDGDRHAVNNNNMSGNALLAGQMLFSQFGVDNVDDFPPEPAAPAATPVGHVDMQEQHSPSRTLLTNSSIHRTDLSDSHVKYCDIKKESDVEFETLRSFDQDSLLDIDGSVSRTSLQAEHSMDGSHVDPDERMHRTSLMIGHELMGLMPGGSHRMDSMEHSLKTNGHSEHMSSSRHGGGPKTWTQDDMELALDALRNHNMSLTKASATYGIPSTTLWQRAHRLGIDTPKKEGPTKSWTEENLNSALDALRTGTISANKASKAYGIPSSTLYKIARREGIRLAAPFNAAPTTWTPEDLEKALESIRTGQTSVQRASTEYGIPTGTLYGRCKREGIELSRSNPTPWSEDAMGEALEAVRLGHMSINQAAIHYNLPYSSLYGRFKRGVKYDPDPIDPNVDSQSQMMDGGGGGSNGGQSSLMMSYENPHQLHYRNQPTS